MEVAKEKLAGFWVARLNNDIGDTTIRPRSLVHSYIATRYITMNKTSWSYSNKFSNYRITKKTFLGGSN